MKERKKVLCFVFCIMVTFAFYFDCYAMNFDAEDLYDSIFVIYSGQYEGSGFAIGENTIVTNAHVIGDMNGTVIETIDGKKIKAYVCLMDESLDIAILGVENIKLEPLKVGDISKIKVGDDIYAIGTPKSLDYTLTKGVISSKKRSMGLHSYIQIDAAINSGNSGGPLLNNEGEVIGVNSMKVSDAEGIGLAISISDVTDFIAGNEIKINEDNNVDGTINPHEETKQKKYNSDENYEEISKNTEMTIFLGIALAISVFLNVVLFVMLYYSKTKDIIVKTDRSDRTDFEIDILE